MVTKLGDAILAKRGAKPLRTAARECGVHFATLSRIERGIGEPSIENLAALAAWLGLTLEEARTMAKEKPRDS
jgi:transcriptional regulator with XRE-family HTH domain